ncbi:MAG: hypothetical protein Q9170_007504, partial [Blastenia crenularia]
MPYHESPSPARRPQLLQRSSSTHSLSRASPTGKGSTTKLHKSHAVGHGRHPHGRVPSHGKNLNKLSKLTVNHGQEEHVRSKDQPKNNTQSPSTSPSTTNPKRNASNINLVHTASKVSVKQNTSNLSQKRNKSSPKLGNLAKPDKTQRKKPDKSNGNGTQFSIGSDDDDDVWTEADSSQSPDMTRRSSFARGQAQSREPLSPDGPPLRSPTQLPASPPQSPPNNGQGTHQLPPHHQKEDRPYSHPPDAEVVTNRLLSRNTAYNAQPQTSTVSATITPSGSSGSPAFNFSQDATLRNEPSMPSDGISRFLNATGSSSVNATSISLSHHLNSALAGVQRNHEPHHSARIHSSSPNQTADRSDRPHSTIHSTSSTEKDDLTPSRSSSSPPQQTTQSAFRARALPSHFAAATRDHPNQSLTQQKLNLQRESAAREPAHAPAVQPPLNSAHASLANLSLTNGSEGGIEDRKRKQWERAEMEYENARRFVGVLGKGLERLEKRGKLSRDVREGKDDGKKSREEGKNLGL